MQQTNQRKAVTHTEKAACDHRAEFTNVVPPRSHHRKQGTHTQSAPASSPARLPVFAPQLIITNCSCGFSNHCSLPHILTNMFLTDFSVPKGMTKKSLT